LLGDTPEQKVRHAAAAVRAHDDQVDVSGVGVADNLFGRCAYAQRIFRAQSRDFFLAQELRGSGFFGPPAA
jgi:hypothetical protein